MWEDHGNNKRANYIQRKDILGRVGLEPEMDEDVGHLLQYLIWPGSREIDMPPVAIMGTEKEARLMQAVHSKKRMIPGYVWDI